MNKIGLLIMFFFTLTSNIRSQSIGKVDEQILDAIVNIDGLGTGFMVEARNPQNDQQSKIFLVTNKHMIGKWTLVDTLIPNPSIDVYLYTKNKSIPVIPIKVDILDKANKLLPSVKIYPNPKIDIVVIDITRQIISAEASGNFSLVYFDKSFLIPLDSIGIQANVGLGDQVFAIGYPAGITSITTNKPILKAGYISSQLTGDLVINTNCENRSQKLIKTSIEGKFFLVDGLIIGGNSGGPIVNLRTSPVKIIKGQLSYLNQEIPNLVFGIVSSTLSNTGISTIYACDYILELINNFISE